MRKTTTDIIPQEYIELRETLTLRARFLLSTLSHRGFQWSALPCTSHWSEVDSEVCAFLKLKDPRWEAEEALEVLEMEEEFAKWRLEHARRERNAGDHKLVPSTDRTTVANFGDQEDSREYLVGYETPAPVDITGLIPPPRAKDSPTGHSPNPLSTIEEEPEETEETAEKLSLRIEDLNTTDEQTKAQKMSKTQKRNIQRKRAKARASEAAKAEGLAGDDAIA